MEAGSHSDPSPVRSGRVNANGIDYYYEIHGEGEPLLVLHGGLGSIDVFGPSPALRAAGRQVIAVDLHGHGRTPLGDRPISLIDMGDDMAVLLERLGYRQVDVIGYSLGGGVAFRLAVQHPEMVRRLVLVSAGFRQDGFYAEMIALQAQMSGAIADRMKDTPMYQSYAAIAPHPEDFPTAARPHGRAHAAALRLHRGRQGPAHAGHARLRRQRHVPPRTHGRVLPPAGRRPARRRLDARDHVAEPARDHPRSDALRHLCVGRPGAHGAAVPERGDGERRGEFGRSRPSGRRERAVSA